MTQIKQHTLQSGEMILMVPLPSDASDLELSHFNYQKYDYTDDWTLIFKSNEDNITYINGDRPHRHLPQGNWQLVGLSDEITEEQASTVIDEPSLFVYVDYTAKVDFGMKRKFDTALESFKSLMQSLGCEGNYAVLREVK